MCRCRVPARLLLIIAILAVLPALHANAGPQVTNALQDQDKLRDGSSLSDAVRRIERTTRGEVLSAERVQYDGRDMHRVKVVDDEGRVRVFLQDPTRLRLDNNERARREDRRADGRDVRDSPRRRKPTRDDDD
ncbi:MAG: hypothetical protein M3R16_08585 [Pseudomonadota bacterium]|nr:hypothetical protein [Pseudomonadota bacterium]